MRTVEALNEIANRHTIAIGEELKEDFVPLEFQLVADMIKYQIDGATTLSAVKRSK